MGDKLSSRALAIGFALSIALAGCGGGASSSGSAAGNSIVPAAASRVTALSASIKSASTQVPRIRDLAAMPQSGAKRATVTVGSSNPAIPDMPVDHPDEPACVVPLFTNDTFVDFSAHPFTYTASCPGPWAKVILNANFNVTAGIQFDRTGNIWIGGTNIYFGTTAEPSPSLSPSWAIQRDVTDLSATLAQGNTGQIILGNIVNSQYTGVISASASLSFYPADTNHPAPREADQVVALSAGNTGGTVALASQTTPLTGTFTLPTNIERAYLDVYLQSQSDDEFWYTCFPNDLAAALNNCGNTAFREGEVSIDGIPAGVAPVFPWIFTGGIDPNLWIPIAGVQTFDFTPYRVDLTPFAGVLSNGQPHTVAVTVTNADNYFSATGSLLLYLDKGTSQVTGGLISDTTPAAPTVNIVEGVKIDQQGNARGPIKTEASHNVYIDGYVNTSHGRVETIVAQQGLFENNQQVISNATQFVQNIAQQTTIGQQITTISRGGTDSVTHSYAWPLVLSYNYVVNTNGSATQTTNVQQSYNLEKSVAVTSLEAPLLSSLADSVNSTDALTIANNQVTGSTGSSTGSYIYKSSDGQCYNAQLASSQYVLTSKSISKNCF